MAKHPVPKDYGSPCNEGEIITNGTGGRLGVERFIVEGSDEEYPLRRNPRSIDNDNMFDRC